MRIPLPTPIKHRVVRGAAKAAGHFGYQLINIADPPLRADFDEQATRIYRQVKSYTLTGPERVLALRDAVRYVCDAEIPGAIVECGVWRGGSMLTVALTLLDLGETSRDLYLFDTFTHMPDATERDRDIFGNRAIDLLPAARAASTLANTPVDEVQRLILNTGYPAERVHMVPGMVEDTVPDLAPHQIALLRLDTDWYASTRHEMDHLYPRLSVGGVLIVDDYGHFLGSREAVDEYFAASNESVLLHRIDFTGRTVVRSLVPAAAAATTSARESCPTRSS